MSVLQHRWPFVLVDEIVSLEPGVSARGIICLSAGDYYAATENAFSPFLIVEACGQVLASALAVKNQTDSGHGLLAGVPRMAFSGQPCIGDHIVLDARVVKRLAHTVLAEIEASVEDSFLLKGQITVVLSKSVSA